MEKEEGVQFQTSQGMNGKTGVHGVKPISRMQCKLYDIIINMIYYVVASSRRVFKTTLGFYFCPLCVCGGGGEGEINLPVTQICLSASFVLLCLSFLQRLFSWSCRVTVTVMSVLVTLVLLYSPEKKTKAAVVASFFFFFSPTPPPPPPTPVFFLFFSFLLFFFFFSFFLFFFIYPLSSLQP